MKIVEGNLWDALGTVDLLLVTTNSIVRQGNLVMGKGVAAQAARRFSLLPLQFGRQIVKQGSVGGVYGVLLSSTIRQPQRPGEFPTTLGAFQTKRDWRRPSTVELISYSAARLGELLSGENPVYRHAAVAFPGIQNGGLTVAEVLPHIDWLPDNVTFYILPAAQEQAGVELNLELE